MELREYIAILWRWAWLILLGVVLAGGTAYLVSINQVAIYQASVTVLVSEARDPTITDYTSILTSERLAKTYGELLTSRPVLEEVIDNLNLELSLGGLAGKVDVELVRDTQLIVVAVEDPSPYWAARIANEIPRVFIQQNESLQSGRYATSLESLSREMDEVDEDIQRTEESIAHLQRPGTAVDQDELARLETNLTQLRGTYSELLQSYEEIRVAEARVIDSIVVVDPAQTPGRPVSPRISLNTALAATVGLIVAVGIVFLIEYLDDTVKTPGDVERVFGLPTLGTIARISSMEKPQDHVVTAHHPRSRTSEAYRMLRTNVQFSTIGNPDGILLVTSPGPLEGKTTTSANLAVTMAQDGRRVILVDSDLRRPALHKFFALHNRLGFTDLILNDQLPIERALQRTGVQGLEVLTSGRLPPNPAELLGSERAQRLLGLLGERADAVILDSPPALAVADTAILAAQSTGVILVVEQGRTRTEEARRGKEALDKTGAKLLGVVLNKVTRKRGYGYYYYYYYDEGGKRRRRKQT